MSLPTDYASRKALPIFDGVLMYFPDAIAAIAAVSVAGNSQHNPGEKLHWAREKSTDQLNTAQRHMMDHGMGNVRDTDGTYHIAKAAWRLLAELQLTIERGRVQTPKPTTFLDIQEAGHGETEGSNPEQDSLLGVRSSGAAQVPDAGSSPRGERQGAGDAGGQSRSDVIFHKSEDRR